MKVMQHNRAIILGDSSHNTLSAVRAIGTARIPFVLVLVGSADPCNVADSKYIKRNRIIRVSDVEECQELFQTLEPATIINTFDAAAEWIDVHESTLSNKHVTPCRGQSIGNLFNKDHQCRLAEKCGLTVPKSVILNKGDALKGLSFPILIKPLYSTKGKKSDIHICQDTNDLNSALDSESECTAFIAQEFIDKEYELDCIGVSTDSEVLIAGAVQKIRHYPNMIGAGAYGIFRPVSELDINVAGVTSFIRRSNYHGPFSVEFLHRNDENYFMEVNFRNEGLAQVATDAGANLHEYYVTGKRPVVNKVKRTYMMNYSIDYLHVKEGRITRWQWWHDLLRTRSFINCSLSDPMPTIGHYLSKFGIK